MKYLRLFIAIDFKKQESYFKELQKQLPGRDTAKLNYVNAYHLTLKFLGDVVEDKVEKIKEKLAEIKFKQFKLHTTKLGCFPDENYVRVIWVGLKDDGHLMKLQKEIEEKLAEFQFTKDFEFLPHLTLARVKFVNNKKEFVDKIRSIKTKEAEVDVKDFRLIKSTLTKEGPLYEELAVFEAE
jgi:2'-5' RNA ligase